MFDFVYVLIYTCFYTYSDFQEDQVPRPLQLPRLKAPSTVAGGLSRMMSNLESLSVSLYFSIFMFPVVFVNLIFVPLIFMLIQLQSQWLQMAYLTMYLIRPFIFKYLVRNHVHVNSK